MSGKTKTSHVGTSPKVWNTGCMFHSSLLSSKGVATKLFWFLFPVPQVTSAQEAQKAEASNSSQVWYTVPRKIMVNAMNFPTEFDMTSFILIWFTGALFLTSGFLTNKTGQWCVV